jgi:hypothetical protein
MIRHKSICFDYIKPNTLSWILILSASSLKQQFVNRNVANSDTLSRFRTNQSLHFPLNAVCLVVKQHIPALKPNYDPSQINML